ncbi:MAG: aldehyde dehydrogenase family protein [Kurthia sp.]|nr:aldehyde dehydrogenase family protein [Candidatus Kurthia equi]
MTTSSKLEVLSFGNGKLIESKNYTDVYDPGALDQLVGRIGNCSVEQVNTVIEDAHEAYLAWSKTTVGERKALLGKASALLPQLVNEYRDLLVREHGGVIWEAETDFMLSSGVLHLYSQIDDGVLATKHVEEETGWYKVAYNAKGVVAAIVPWNMPLILTMNKLGPALVAGNTIVIKPSPFAPLALTLVLRKIAELFPPGVINVTNGDIAVGEVLSQHPLVRKVAFTGGTNTGKIVMANAAQTIKEVTLELGGNDPAIVLEDADFEKIIPKLLKGVFTRSGQICFAVKRTYVPKTRADEFYEAIKAYVEKFKIGHGLQQDADFGPVNNAKQYKMVKQLIEQAKQLPNVKIEEVGHKLTPETWANGYYILPHLLVTTDPSIELVAIEQFGPIMPIIIYDEISQAIEWANQFEYGLGSSVWGTDIDKAYEVALQIEAGNTFINSHSFDSLSLGMPFGGIKQSGIGRELAVEESIYGYIDLHSIRLVKE